MAEVVFLSVLSGCRCPLGSHFGDVLETVLQLWMRTWGLGSYLFIAFVSRKCRLPGKAARAETAVYTLVVIRFPLLRELEFCGVQGRLWTSF